MCKRGISEEGTENPVQHRKEGHGHWSGESKLTMTFKAVKTLKPGPRSVELNKFLAFLQFFFQANYLVVLTSAVQKYLKLFVNIRKSFSCFILFKCAWSADCYKQKIMKKKSFVVLASGTRHPHYKNQWFYILTECSLQGGGLARMISPNTIFSHQEISISKLFIWNKLIF